MVSPLTKYINPQSWKLLGGGDTKILGGIKLCFRVMELSFLVHQTHWPIVTTHTVQPEHNKTHIAKLRSDRSFSLMLRRHPRVLPYLRGHHSSSGTLWKSYGSKTQCKALISQMLTIKSSPFMSLPMFMFRDWLFRRLNGMNYVRNIYPESFYLIDRIKKEWEL